MNRPITLRSARAARPRVFVLGNYVQACCWGIQRLPRAGETVPASALHIEPGGKGLNVAVCLQRLGAQVDTLIGCGSDAAGDTLLALAAREGIATDHIHRFPGASGWGAGLIAADGQNAIAVFPGANLSLTSEHAARAADAIAEAQLVYGQFETSMAAVEAAFTHAHLHQVPTVLNPSPWQTPTEALRHATHTVIVNEVEATDLLRLCEPLTGQALDCARRISARLESFWSEWTSTRHLIVTLGAAGSLAFERPGNGQPTTYWQADAYPIQAIDTVGAGDAFASGYCAAMLAGYDLADAIVWGNACGAHLAAQSGVLAALPNDVTLKNLLTQEPSPRVTRQTISSL
jgi:ribokinase